MIDFDCDFLSLSKSKRSRYFRFLLCVFCLTWLRRGARGRRLPKSFSHCLQSSLRSNLRRAPDHGASVQRTSFRQSSRPVFVFVCCKCVFESCSVPPDLFTVAPGMNFGAWQVFFFSDGPSIEVCLPVGDMINHAPAQKASVEVQYHETSKMMCFQTTRQIAAGEEHLGDDCW